jgi:L-rhamnonate dehydratase
MKITSIRAFAITNPTMGGAYSVRKENDTLLRRPPWTKDAEVANPMSRYPRYKALRSSWLANKLGTVGCIVTADDGSWGFGTTGYGAATISLINDHIGPLLEGENPMATEKLYDMMTRITSAYSPSGLASYAISAIDLALWDLKGNVLKMPVYEIAGGPARDNQFCYATGNDTDWHMELGFKATKLACPYGTADGLDGLVKNEAFVAETREFIGNSVELMLDCWMAFDVEFAVRLAERLRPYKLRWMEDCLIPEDHTSHKALRDRLPWQTLTTGEHWYTPYTFYEAARDRVVDIFQPDIHWVGGFTACQRIAAIADAAGLEVILHAGMNTPYGQHFTYASTNTRWGEYFVGGGPGVPLELTTGFPGMQVPKDGYAKVSDAPGFGHGLTLDHIDEMARNVN